MKANVTRQISLARRHRQGYVLMVVLLMIAMIGLMTVGFAKFSMLLAVDSFDREREIQTKWGIASCERFAFENLNQLLERKQTNLQTGEIESRPANRSQARVQLGEQLFIVRLDDECAKLNLNFIFEAATIGKVKSLVRKFSSNMKIDPLSLADSRGRTAMERSFETWEQIFVDDFDNHQQFLDQLRTNSQQLTCWGHTINYRTAPEPILFEMLKQIAGATNATKLIKKLNEHQGSFDDAVADLPAEHRREIGAMVKSTSSTHSIWTEVQSSHRSIHALTIRERVGGTLNRVKTFSW